MRKKKTVFWIGVLKDTFRVSFFFGDKAEPLIESSDMPDSIKNNFKTAKRYNHFRGITVEMKNNRDVETVLMLVDVKLKLK